MIDRAQDLQFINDHREAVGRSLIERATDAEIRAHLAKIERHAPYGNDPWARH